MIALAVQLASCQGPQALRIIDIVKVFPLRDKFKPFGKQAVTVFDRPLADAAWALTFGIVLGTVAVIGALSSLLVPIAAPLSIQWIKVAKTSLFPFSTYLR